MNLHDLRSATASSGRGTVAAAVFGACVKRAIKVSMPKVPRRTGSNRPAAPRTRHATRRNACLPTPAKTFVARYIPSCDGLLRPHSSSARQIGGKCATRLAAVGARLGAVRGAVTRLKRPRFPGIPASHLRDLSIRSGHLPLPVESGKRARSQETGAVRSVPNAAAAALAGVPAESMDRVSARA